MTYLLGKGSIHLNLSRFTFRLITWDCENLLVITISFNAVAFLRVVDSSQTEVALFCSRRDVATQVQ